MRATEHAVFCRMRSVKTQLESEFAQCHGPYDAICCFCCISKVDFVVTHAVQWELISVVEIPTITIGRTNFMKRVIFP